MFVIEPLRSASTWDQLAVGFSVDNKPFEALKLSTRAIQARPQGARYWFSRGMTHLKIARESNFPEGAIAPDREREAYQLAISDLTQAIVLDPQFEKALSQRALAYGSIGEYELALDDIRRALSIASSNPDNLSILSQVLRELGRLDESLEAQRSEERIRASAHWRDLRPGDIEPGRPHVGDEPALRDEGGELIARASLAALDHLGVTDPLRRECYAIVISRESRKAVREGCVSVLASLGAIKELRDAFNDVGICNDLRVVIGSALCACHNDDASNWLTGTAADPAAAPVLRIAAVRALEGCDSAEQIIGLVRQIKDVDWDPEDSTIPPAKLIPVGFQLVLLLLRTCAGKQRGLEAIRELIYDRSVAAGTREAASNILWECSDKPDVCDFFTGLSQTLAPDDPLLKCFHSTIAGFKRNQKEGPARRPADPYERGLQAFLRAESEDEIQRLASEHQVFYAPAFVERVSSMSSHVSPQEQSRFERKLARLRSLPPNPLMRAMHLFFRASSLESMREAVEQYPLLASSVVHRAIEAMIAEGAPGGSDDASVRRLEWLRQIPLNRLAEAQYAFIFARDDASLKAALDEHPEMRTVEFENSVKRALGERSDWALIERRLERLRALAGDAGERSIVDEAFRDIQDENPESALERLKNLPPSAHYSSRVVQAAAHAEAGRRSEAINELTSLIDEHPHSIVLRMRGRLLTELSRFRDAIGDFTRALELDPRDAEAWLGRGLAHSALNMKEESIFDFTRAELLGECGAVSRATRGRLYLEHGQLDRAVEDFSALAADPGATQLTLMCAGMLAMAGHSSEAHRVLGVARIHCGPEDGEDIECLMALFSSPDDMTNMHRILEGFMNTRSPAEVIALMRREIAFTDMNFIRTFQAYARASLPGEMLGEFAERMGTVGSVISNPAQQAFNALLQAASDADVRAAYRAHQLLADPEFRAQLHRIEADTASDDIRRRLTANLAVLEAFHSANGERGP